MRQRLALLLALVLVLSLSTTFVATASAHDRVVLAQTSDEETPADEAGTEEEGAESGAEDAEPAEPEPGPIWTYQMARISIALLVLMLLAMGGAYYRFVHKRQQEGI